MTQHQPATSLDGVALLSHLGVIRVSGADAIKFIHGLLTQDFATLPPHEARLAALCTAQGRMLASFIGIKRSDQEVLLVCSRDLLDRTLKRLSMFVLRAKATLEAVSEQFHLYGLAGNATINVAQKPYSVWARVDFDAASLINLYPAHDTPRQLWIGPASLAPPPGPALESNLWLWSEIQSAVATLSAAVVETFVPQMLNYESVGGVNFKKGCYPGQEVVARSQFRGTIKRRAFVMHSEAAMAAGDLVYASSDAHQPVGTVVQACAAPTGGFDAIVSVQLSALQGETLHWASASGPALAPAPLPYPLRDEV